MEMSFAPTAREKGKAKEAMLDLTLSSDDDATPAPASLSRPAAKTNAPEIKKSSTADLVPLIKSAITQSHTPRRRIVPAQILVPPPPAPSFERTVSAASKRRKDSIAGAVPPAAKIQRLLDPPIDIPPPPPPVATLYQAITRVHKSPRAEIPPFHPCEQEVQAVEPPNATLSEMLDLTLSDDDDDAAAATPPISPVVPVATTSRAQSDEKERGREPTLPPRRDSAFPPSRQGSMEELEAIEFDDDDDDEMEMDDPPIRLDKGKGRQIINSPSPQFIDPSSPQYIDPPAGSPSPQFLDTPSRSNSPDFGIQPRQSTLPPLTTALRSMRESFSELEMIPAARIAPEEDEMEVDDIVVPRVDEGKGRAMSQKNEPKQSTSLPISPTPTIHSPPTPTCSPDTPPHRPPPTLPPPEKPTSIEIEIDYPWPASCILSPRPIALPIPEGMTKNPYYHKLFFRLPEVKSASKREVEKWKKELLREGKTKKVEVNVRMMEEYETGRRTTRGQISNTVAQIDAIHETAPLSAIPARLQAFHPRHTPLVPSPSSSATTNRDNDDDEEEDHHWDMLIPQVGPHTPLSEIITHADGSESLRPSDVFADYPLNHRQAPGRIWNHRIEETVYKPEALRDPWGMDLLDLGVQEGLDNEVGFEARRRELFGMKS